MFNKEKQMALLLILSIVLAWTLWGPQQTFVTQLLWTKRGFTQVSTIEQGWPINNQIFLIDYNRSDIVLSNDRAASGWDSSFYEHPLFGDTDAFVFAGVRYQLPFTVNYGTLLASRCQQCDGIFGIGRGSPLLDYYSSMSAGGYVTLMDEFSLRSQLAQSHSTACNFLSNTLCDLPVRITRIDGKTGTRRVLSNNTLMLLAPHVPETTLPNQIFLDVVGGLSTVKDPMSTWPDLEFCAVAGAVADGSDVCFTIPRELILPTDRGYDELAIWQSDTDYAQLGTTALRGLTVHYFLKAGTVGFSQEPVVLSVGNFTIFLSVLAVILLYCLSFTRVPVLPPSAIARIKNKQREKGITASYEYPAKVRMIIEIIALIVLPLMILVQNAPANLWASSPYIAVGSLVVVVVAWFSGIYAQIQYKAADVNGTTFSEGKERWHLARTAWLRASSSIVMCVLALLIFSMETFVNGKVTMLMLLLAITLNLMLMRTVLVLIQLAFVHKNIMTFLHIGLWLIATFASYVVTSAEIATPMMRAMLTDGSASTWVTPLLFAFLILVLSLVFQQAQVLYFLHFIENGNSLLLNQNK